MDGGEQNQEATPTPQPQNQDTPSTDLSGSDITRNFERVRSEDLICKSENPDSGGSFEIKGNKTGGWSKEDK